MHACLNPLTFGQSALEKQDSHVLLQIPHWIQPPGEASARWEFGKTPTRTAARISPRTRCRMMCSFNK
jgi:hypothetical protein